jgi:hypothetical protein
VVPVWPIGLNLEKTANSMRLKMHILHKKNLEFLAEKTGKSEAEFKLKIKDFLSGVNQKIRAYLALVEYEDKSLNVVLCFKSKEGENINIVNAIVDIFENMFIKGEHLDILFLTDEQEFKLREVCFPFFVSADYEPDRPDFYLISKEGYEGYNLNKPHGCIKIKRLANDHPDGYLLCSVNPPLLNKDTGKEITQVILAQRHHGYSLFPIKEWPAYVHVAVPLVSKLQEKERLISSDIQLIAWAELNKKL